MLQMHQTRHRSEAFASLKQAKRISKRRLYGCIFWRMLVVTSTKVKPLKPSPCPARRGPPKDVSATLSEMAASAWPDLIAHAGRGMVKQQRKQG